MHILKKRPYSIHVTKINVNFSIKFKLRTNKAQLEKWKSSLGCPISIIKHFPPFHFILFNLIITLVPWCDDDTKTYITAGRSRATAESCRYENSDEKKLTKQQQASCHYIVSNCIISFFLQAPSQPTLKKRNKKCRPDEGMCDEDILIRFCHALQSEQLLNFKL